MSTTANPADDRARTIHERHAALFPDGRHGANNQGGQAEGEGGQSEGGRSSGGGMTLDMAQKANKGDQEPATAKTEAPAAPKLTPQSGQQPAQEPDEQKAAPTRAEEIHRRHAEMYGEKSRHHQDGAAQSQPATTSTDTSKADTSKADSNKPAAQSAGANKPDTSKAEPEKLRNLDAIRVPDDIHAWRAAKAEKAQAAATPAPTQAQTHTQVDVNIDVEKARPRTMR